MQSPFRPIARRPIAIPSNEMHLINPISLSQMYQAPMISLSQMYQAPMISLSQMYQAPIIPISLDQMTLIEKTNVKTNLLPSELIKECLFVLKKPVNWNEPFDTRWTYKQAIEWGRDNSHPTLTPSTVSYGSNAYALWRCESGHMWTVNVNARGSRGNGCRICRGGRIPKNSHTIF